jgi:CHAT domain-containing protein
MKIKFLFLILAICGAAQGASASGNPPAVLFVHAWLPELGPLEAEPTAAEVKLLAMAEHARRGDIKAAIDSATAMLAANPDNRTRYLILIFRHEITRRSVLVAGGSDESIDEDLTLVRMILSRQDHSDLNEARKLASDLGDSRHFEAMQNTETIMNRCLEMVLTYRYSTSSPQFAAQEEQITKNEDAFCTEHAASFEEPGASSQRAAVDRELLTRLINARVVLQTRNDLPAARSELQRGLAMVQQQHWPAAETLWLLRRGDLEASPRGSMLSFGYELSAESGVRSDLGAGRSSVASLYDRQRGSTVEAVKFYLLAERRSPGSESIAPSDFAIRRAFLKYLRNEPSGAEFRRTADLAKAEDSPWNESMARTCAGLLLNSHDDFAAAMESSSTALLPGAGVSMAQLALSWNRRAVAQGERSRAIQELRAVADVLPGHGLETSRSDLLLSLSSLESDVNREDASIESLSEAITDEKQFLHTAGLKRPEAAPDAGFGELVDESGIRLRIAEGLMELEQSLRAREAQEGLVEFSERRANVEKEAHDLESVVGKEDPQMQALFQTMNTMMAQGDDLKRLAAQIDRFHRMGSCPDIMRSFNNNRSALEGQDNPMLAVQSLIAAGTCEPSLLEEARQKLSGLHPVDDVKAALQRVKDPSSVERELVLHPALDNASDWCMIADLAEAGQLLEQWTDGIEKALTGGNYPELPPQQLTYFHARAHTILGDSASASRLLADVESDEPFWSYQARPGFRRDVLKARVEADVMSGDAAAALLATERDRAQQEYAQELASGVSANDPGSAEAAMLLRRAALEGDFDRQRLGELQRAASADQEQFRLPTSADLRAGLQSLPAGTTTLVYYPLQRELAIWRIDPGARPRLIRVPVHSADLLRLTLDLRGRLSDHEAGWEVPAEKLYQILIAPAGPIAAGRTLVVLGAGRLGGIPIDALRDEKGSLLLASHPVVYLSALADTQQWPAAKRRRSTSLIVGINAGGLTAPEGEARQVASHLGADALTGPEATTEQVRLRLADARLIHFATHGVVDAENPYRSYLALADGPLEAWTVFREIGGADLIVLSACDTRRGPRNYMAQLSSDESSISGFVLRGGVRRVVSSLWGATDTATSALMESFYTEMDRDASDPARALQLAKLSIAGPGRHPYTFANFALSVLNPAMIRMPAPQTRATMASIPH